MARGVAHTALLLLLAVAASAGALFPGAAAQAQPPPPTAAPLVITARANSTGSASGQDLINSTLSSVNQSVPSFYAVRACVPYNLVIEPTPFPGSAADASSNATNTTSAPGSNNQGRIQITADYYVINATQAAVVNGVLSLSLLQGFESHQPIQVTIYTSPSRQLRYVANYGPGNVVLRPGLNVSTFEVESSGVGQVLTYGVTADALRVRSSGIAGSIMRGSFGDVQVTASGTGTLVVTSTTPAQVSADVSGITTLLLDVPAGSTINGTADGLAKVQYTSGTCDVQSASQLPFPSFSIFGRRGGPFAGFGSSVFGGAGPSGSTDNGKCEQVAAGAVSSYTEGAGPQWSCGVVADGRSSCAAGGASGSNTTAGSSGIINWSITNVTSAPLMVTNSSTPLDQLVANAVSSNIRSRVNDAAQNATSSNDAEAPPALNTVTGFFPPVGSAGEPPLEDGNASASNAAPGDGAVGNAADGGAGTAANSGSNAAGSSNAGNTAGADNAAPNSGNAFGGEPNALMAAAQQEAPPTDSVTPVNSSSPSPGPQPTTTPTPGGVTTTSTPQGTVTTGATTSGPGSFASGTGSVSNGTSGFTQNTLSADGGVPLTTLLPGGIGGVVWNPVFVPALTSSAFPDLSEPTPRSAGSTGGTGTAASAGDSGETAATGAQNSTGAGGDSSFTAPGSGNGVRFATNVPQPAIGQAVSVAGPGQGSATSSGTSSSGAPGSVAGVAVASTTCAATPGALLIPGLA